MKKTITALVLIAVLLPLTACGPTVGKVDNVEVNITESSKFTEAEIGQAIEVTKEKFKEFEYCELRSLSYDEEKSNFQLEYYGKEIDSENMMVLFSHFYVDSRAGGAWNPDSDYDWIFILSREDKNSNWKVDDWGYY